MIKKYKRKPEFIEAIKWKKDNLQEILDFTKGEIVNVIDKRIIALSSYYELIYNENFYVIKWDDGEFSTWSATSLKEEWEEVVE